MGEIADSIIDGELDEITGEYIGPGVGYPRSNYRRKPITNNKWEVWKMMFPPGNPGNLSEHNLFRIAERYVHEELKLPQNIKEATGYKHILKDRERFKKWFAETYPHDARHFKKSGTN